VLAGRPGGEPVRLTAGGPVLGVCPGADFEEGRARLDPGGLLAVFSDGLTEARDRGGGCSGRSGCWRRCGRGAGPAALPLGRLLREVEGFCGGRGPADDVSVILLRRRPR
jgi:phosphoserine phosphatase RsbU/P